MVPGCREKKELWRHLSICSEKNCAVQNCKLSAWQARVILGRAHSLYIADRYCDIVCVPLKKYDRFVFVRAAASRWNSI